MANTTPLTIKITEIENKIPDANYLVMKTNFNAKLQKYKIKYHTFNNL